MQEFTQCCNRFNSIFHSCLLGKDDTAWTEHTQNIFGLISLLLCITGDKTVSKSYHPHLKGNLDFTQNVMFCHPVKGRNYHLLVTKIYSKSTKLQLQISHDYLKLSDYWLPRAKFKHNTVTWNGKIVKREHQLKDCSILLH